MKTMKLLAVLIAYTQLTIRSDAATYYVDVANSAPAAPYTNWLTAATNIQDAVDAATPGALVLVTNGVYATGGRAMAGNLTNRVALNKPITLKSCAGAELTVIQGQWDPTTTNGPLAIRCAWLTDFAVIDGFALNNGATLSEGANDLTSGGGVWCKKNNSMVINCILSNNIAANQGGGAAGGRLTNCILRGNRAFAEGGGACSNQLEQCILIENSANGGAGAIYATLNSCQLIKNQGGHQGGGAQNSILNNCLVVSNTANAGAGVFGSTLSNCVLNANSANNGGGAYGSTIINSIITNNLAVDSGAGAAGGTFNNCLFLGNQGARGGGVWPGVLTNCTLVGNYASQTGGGARGATLYNCILWGNSSPDGANYYIDVTLRFTCSSPLAGGAGNISSTPLFADALTGDYRPQSNSPCINAGNNTYVSGTKDLGGSPRIKGGTVDIGAYEFQTPASVLSYAWAQQYGLPTDGTADMIDSDGDGMNNWQEWIASTIPTNTTSYLQMLTVSNSVSGAKVTWQSVSGKTYFMQRSTNLSMPPPFSSIQSNLTGQANTTSFTDTAATNDNSVFYRVGVQ